MIYRDIALDRLRSAETYWYLGSPYTNYYAGLDVAHLEASRAAAWLISQDVRVFCPISHSHPIAIHGDLDAVDAELWHDADLPLLKAASGLIVCQMNGWRQSKGLQKEIAEFERSGKPIEWMRWPRG